MRPTYLQAAKSAIAKEQLRECVDPDPGLTESHVPQDSFQSQDTSASEPILSGTLASEKLLACYHLTHTTGTQCGFAGNLAGSLS